MSVYIPVLITVVLNILAVSFALGKFYQSVTAIKERLELLEENRHCNNERREKWEDKIEEKASTHSMLPECIEEFKEINRQLGSLTGKVDILINSVKSGGCND